MKDRLFPFQEDARDELLSKIRKAHILWQETGWCPLCGGKRFTWDF